MRSKVFIIDDHPIVRQGLSKLINQEQDMICVGEAGDSAEAMGGIATLMPDLAIVDISLKGTSGIELAKKIIIAHPKMLLLMISMYDESIYLERSLRAGAKGYIMKQEATDHIIAAIRKILKGENYVSDKMKDYMMHQFITGGKVVEGSAAGRLSDRELEVLQLTGQGYSTHNIAENLFISIKTVESHYANIKNKLGLQNSHELIQYAVKMSFAET